MRKYTSIVFIAESGFFMLCKSNNNFFDTYGPNDPILNWRIGRCDNVAGSNYQMGDGYYEACVFLIRECLNNNGDKKGDAWIFPIMFCANQFIELYLKGVVTQIEQIKTNRNSDWDIDITKGSHDIKNLAKKLYKEQEKNTYPMLAPLTELQVVVDFTEIIFEKDQFDITFSRYPTSSNRDKKTKNIQPNKPQFYNVNYENCGLNLKLFLEWVMTVYNILVGVAYNLEAILDSHE